MNEEKIKSTITMNSKLSDVVYDENKLNIYLFWGKDVLIVKKSGSF